MTDRKTIASNDEAGQQKVRNYLWETPEQRAAREALNPVSDEGSYVAEGMNGRTDDDWRLREEKKQ